MVNIEFSSTKHHGKYFQCPAFNIKQSPAGRSPDVVELPELIQLKCSNYHLHELQWSNLTVCRVKSR